MAIREIRVEGDPCLNKVCRVVDKFDERLHILLDDMKDTLKKAQGVGLAAPQVGILKRVVVIDTGEEMVELVNPVLTYTEGSYIDVEGCLSLPGKVGTVERPMKATCRAQNRYGEEIEFSGEELYAKCICHELDHLDGILYSSKVVEWKDIDDED
ncbi:MAG: peptide deformylase [Clostridia bacterium]